MDFVAKRYGCLPSKLLDQGWNIDVVCANIGQAYENYLQKRAQEGAPQHNHSETELLAMMERVKHGKG